MSWIDEYVKPGMVAVDIGACHGAITSELMQAVGPTGTVYAIEPQGELAAPLRGLASVVLTMAIGDRDKATDLYYSEQAEHASLYKPNILVDVGRRMPVLMRTLDSLQQTGELPPRIDAIKVDAQGAEAAIFRGAVNLMRTQKPIWWVELWAQGLEHAGDSVESVCALAKAAGYEIDGQSFDDACHLARGQGGHGSIDVLFKPC